MIDKESIPEVGPWAKVKLKCLGNYLNAYTKILRNQNFRGYVYIDAFAGSGKAKIRKRTSVTNVDEGLFHNLLQESSTERLNEDAGQEKYIEGSPRVALNLEYPFTYYVFIELNEKRLTELNKLKEEHSDKDIRIHDFNCNDYLQKLSSKNINWNEWRGVIFLDPFGTDVSWETVKAIGSTKSFEVFINFPWMAITRLANNDGNIIEENRAILDKYFGSNEWYDVMYNQESDLFGPSIRKEQGAAKVLLNWYRGRLIETFGYASTARLITNTKNSPLYYLIWAGPNNTGQKIANYILSQGEAI